MVQETFETFKKYHRCFFPNSILNRLENRLSTGKNKHRLQKKLDNPRTGTLDIEKPLWASESSICNIVRAFYKDEGFEVQGKNYLIARRGNEEYSIHFSSQGSIISILVYD